MRAFEFNTDTGSDHKLVVPPEIAIQLDGNQPVHVLLLIQDDTEAEDWERLAAQEFLLGYAESDAIYDQSKDEYVC